mgnify:CR=1 FL=1
MGKYFGTDGFRGEAGITLTADHAYKVGRFLGWYYNALRERNGDTDPARIVIGKDTRRSSYMFEYSLVAGLTASGADAYLLHVTTTPSVAYIARVDDFDCGIMISASHNPYYDNGIKLIDCYGEKMPEETLLLVEDYIDGKLHVFDKDWPELPFAHREHIGCTVDYVAGRNRYMGYLISLGIYSFKGVKVGLDCANGSSWNIAKSVFDALGADTYVINNNPNGLNINNNAGSTHIEGLQKFVVEKGLDVGFAYDGDADRCLCVDEKGNVITGDHILYIYGCYMKERGKLLNNTVVTTVMSNFGLYKAFDEQGIGYAKTAVGDKYVYEYIKQMRVYEKLKKGGVALYLKIENDGTAKATDVRVSATFPECVHLMNIDDVKKLVEPPAPKLPPNPIDAAEKKYERKMNPMVDLANYFACVQPSYSFDAINSSFLSNRLDTKDYCFYIDENSIFAENRQLPHKDAGIFDDFYMIPVKKGDAKIKISMMCSEYVEPEEQYIDIQIV